MNQFLNNILKWTVQIVCMLGDVALIVAAIILTISALKSGSLVLLVVGAIVISMAYNTWKSQGGFIAWTHWKQFMANWDKISRGEHDGT